MSKNSTFMTIVITMMIVALVFTGFNFQNSIASKSSNTIYYTSTRDIPVEEFVMLARSAAMSGKSSDIDVQNISESLKIKLAALTLSDALFTDVSPIELYKMTVRDGANIDAKEKEKVKSALIEAEKEMRLRAVSDMLASTNFTPQKLNDKLSSLFSNRSYSLKMVSLGPNNKHTIPTQKQIEDHFNANKHRFNTDKLFQLEYIHVRADELPVSTPSDSELLQFFNANTKHYLDSQSTYKKIIATPGKTMNKSSSKLADKHVEELKKSTNINDFVVTISNVKINELAQHTQKSLQSNGISFWEPSGENYVMFLVDTPTKITLREVHNQVKKDYITHARQTKLSHLMSETTEAAYTNPNSLNEAAKVTQKPIMTSKYFSALDNERIPEPFSPLSLNQLQNSTLMIDRFNSKPVYLGAASSFVVYRIKSIQESKPENLQQASNKIRAILQKQMIEDVAARCEKMSSLDEVSNYLGTKVTKHDHIDLNNSKYTPIILSCAGKTLCRHDTSDNILFASTQLVKDKTAKPTQLNLASQIEDSFVKDMLAEADIKLNPNAISYIQKK